MAETVRGTSVGEKNSDLMKSLRGVRPEVPSSVRVLGTGIGSSLLAMNEIRELHGVLDEEHRSVVSDHVVVTLLSVELDGESSGITIAIVGATLSSDSGESEEDGSLFTDLVKELSLGKPTEI